jgi:hypothetical protein
MSIKFDDFILRPGTEIEYTPDLIKELYKCSQDYFYFLKYVKILHADQGRIPFEPRPYQKEFLDMVVNNRFVVGNWARQSGKTTCLGTYVIWYAIFNNDKYIGIGSNSAKSAQDFLSRVKMMYEELPIWLKPGVKIYNELSLIFENGSSINTAATTKNAFRGRTANLMILDEFAHLISDKIADEFYAANYTAITASSESKLIIISTPKGLFNLFGRVYTGAEQEKNGFKHSKATWRDVPGRDEAWKKEQLENLNYDYNKFKQEFEGELIGSTTTVIDADVLKRLIESWKPPIKKDFSDKLNIYEFPELGALYVIGADPAKGTGRNYSSLQILKVLSLKPIKLKQVATFNDNHIDVYKFSELIHRIAIYYNKAYVMVENNGEGAPVVNELWWGYEYENLYNSGPKSEELGIRATKATKPKAVLLMKRLIEDGSLELVDEMTIAELADFIEDKNKFLCENLNDDLVSALYWGCYILTTEYLDETFEFEKKVADNDEGVWGILCDVKAENDWSWLTV